MKGQSGTEQLKPGKATSREANIVACRNEAVAIVHTAFSKQIWYRQG
jgi:hypothetical protein